MKIKVVEISSGFANVQNDVILAEHYSSAAMNRPGSAYDKFYTIEIPDGFEIAKCYGGWTEIFHENSIVNLCSVNHEKRHITGVNADGFYHFKIVDE